VRAQAGTLTQGSDVYLALRLLDQSGALITDQQVGDGIPPVYTLGNWSEIGGVVSVPLLPGTVTLGFVATGTGPPVSGYIDDIELFVLDCPPGD
jgi:hypothetical protein